ncbi:beta-lactamase family protein [Rubellimicrobium rubrum]|uniref:Beta-lactamase family protein n=1 Tax=Rubellimicrobium rubrum TaxID=2585369 RepID=A0A5C4MT53_9RHOB|nr:serine hydrolase domain-containing protein [Rubellimicrobium rubrum]TNC47295.1 beta-lactamase family protein [Rubellimicrobium rubrum]
MAVTTDLAAQTTPDLSAKTIRSTTSLARQSALPFLVTPAWTSRLRSVTAGGLLALGAAAPGFAQAPEVEPSGAHPEGLNASAAVAPEIQPQATPLNRADLESWLDGFMPFALARGDVAGAVAVVVRDGEVLLQKGYGLADVAAGTPVLAQDTLFRVGSVSKLVTWTAVMQQVELGALDLDTDVNQYIGFTIPPFDGQPITLRHLMTHTAGFAESLRHLITDDPSHVVPMETYLRENLPPRIFPPGTTPAYSNYGTALAAHLVERASGLSFDDYIERHVFARLGMARSSFRQPLPEDLQPLVSQSYDVASGKAQPYEIVVPAPAGSLAASGADMGRFMIAHLEDGRGLLRPETAALMHDTTTRLVPPLNGMALGFYEQEVNGRRAIGHAGDTEFSHSQLMLFPAEDVGLFVAVNSNGTPGTAHAIRAALLQEFADRYFPAPPRTEERIDAATSAEHAAQMAGRYVASRGSPTTFLSILDLVAPVRLAVDEEGSLSAPAFPGTADQPQHWVETEPNVWGNAPGDTRVAAVVENGKVVRISYDAASPFLVFDRVPWWRDPAWLLPAVMTSLLVVALSALAWPAGAVARWRHGVPQPLRGKDLWGRRMTHGFSWLVLLAVVGWVAFIGLGLSRLALLGGPLDPLLRSLQILTPVIFGGLALSAAREASRAWTGTRGWGHRLWGGILLAAALLLLWVAWAYDLISWGLHY